MSRLWLTPEEIVAEYGHLSLSQVYAALTYYHANRDEIEALIDIEEKLWDEVDQNNAQPTLPIEAPPLPSPTPR